MLLMVLHEAQAVHGLLFLSPSAAALCRGILDPTLGFRPGPPARDPALLGTCQVFSSPWALRMPVGPGRIPAGPTGPDRSRSLRVLALRGVSTADQGGGCGASRLRDAGLRPHCPHPIGSPPFCACLRCVSLPCRRASLLSRARGRAASTPANRDLKSRLSVSDRPAPAPREPPSHWQAPQPGCAACFDAIEARLSGSLTAPLGPCCAGPRPFFCSEQWAGQDGVRAVGFIAGRSRRV
jgi:hypothetical protein